MAILGVALGVFRDVRKRLPENCYGLCSGSSDKRPDRAGVLPLTDWLHDFFQSLAGRTPTDDPVTLGDLWGDGHDETAPRDIELVLMTTNVTRGISHRFPFLEGSWGQLYYSTSCFQNPSWTGWSSTPPRFGMGTDSKCPRVFTLFPSRRTCRSCSARA
jgi:hypothetical protein